MGGKAAHAEPIAGRKVSKRRQLRDVRATRQHAASIDTMNRLTGCSSRTASCRALPDPADHTEIQYPTLTSGHRLHDRGPTLAGIRNERACWFRPSNRMVQRLR